MKFIAHRGYSKCHPENTIEAFDAALKHPNLGSSIIGIELDIQMTSDRKIIVFHDGFVYDVNGNARKLCDMKYAEIADAFAVKTGGAKVCTFGEVIDLVGHKTALYVEIKDGDYDKDIFYPKLASLLDSYAPRNDIVIHSFSAAAMSRAMQCIRHLDVEYGFLFSDISSISGLPSEVLKSLDYLHPCHEILLKEHGAIRDFKRPINVWTVNDRKILAEISNLPRQDLVRAVITDDLELAG